MIRPIEPRDVPRLKELATGFEWEFGSDFMDGLVLVDSSGRPVVFVGAWKVAEVHLAIDGEWKTPALRMIALQQVHQAMNDRMKAQGVKRTVTWMDGMRAFGRRLKGLGWIESKVTSWIREIR